ncbi:MAG TPA: spore maturation protein [Propionibacteriaceae bacterium]|nr:spore maturation protein [Propionibacteriaceae bacterium]
MSRLLLISPAFHGYWRSIAQAFTDLGYDVTAHPYDGGTKIERVRRKVRYQIPERLGLATDAQQRRCISERTASIVRRVRPDRLLVIKGDLLDAQFWDEFGPIPSALWLYDELRRTLHDDASLAPYRAIASYSHDDVASLSGALRSVAYVPLAFDQRTVVTPRQTNEIVFVGARYPRRAQLLVDLSDRGIPVRAYGQDWSSHPVDMVRTYRYRPAGVPAARTLARAAAYDVMAGAPATLNIHGDQDGFTMRTFEAGGIGAVHLVDRPDVQEFYEPGREVAVFENDDELADLSRRAINDAAWGDGLRNAARKRTLAEHTFTHRARSLETLWG